MKKFIALMLVLTMAFAFVACAESENTSSADESVTESKTESVEASTEASTEESTTESTDDVKVMTFEEYLAAEVGTEVTVETYVQAKQGWWEKEGVGGVATFYTQNEEGAYFIYDMPCSKEDYDEKLVKGAKIRVSGAKAAFNGEVEIVDATYEVLEGTWEAEALNITDKLGDETLIDDMNKYVLFDCVTIVAANDSGAAFLYKWDGSGSEGDDIYFKVSVGGEETYTFVIESYLTGKDTDVYKAAQNLNVGDCLNMKGFLYWYEGVQPHIVAIESIPA